MPDFLITSPDGVKYKVTGPDGSTEAQALHQLQTQLATPDQPKLNPAEEAAAANRKATMEGISNIPGSALNMAGDIAHVVAHPIETGENLYSLGKGILQKFGIVGGEDSVKYADAVGQFFKDRYGSEEAAMATLKKDPVGALADVATVLTGGGAAAAKLPGLAGKVGEIASAVGKTVDPLNAVGAAATAAGKGAAEVIGGLGTHTGAAPIIEAAKAGAAGGSKAQDFRDNLFGRADMTDAVAEAKAAVGQLRNERGNVYRSEMAKVGKDSTVLDFDKIDKAVSSVDSVKKYKGQDLSPETTAIREKLTTAVDDWRSLDPKEFHTAEGLDALKQKLGDIRDATEHGTPSRRVADAIYNSVKATIVDQAPEYAKVMKGYEEATGLIKEMEQTLSLKPGANVDTTLRKLQSVLRDNVNANYGRRGELADFLVSAGAKNLLSKLAGQSLSSLTPRGLGKLTAGAAAGGAFFNPHVLAALPLTSPMAVGLAAHGAGMVSRLPLRTLGQSGFQLGRLPH